MCSRIRVAVRRGFRSSCVEAMPSSPRPALLLGTSSSTRHTCPSLRWPPASGPAWISSIHDVPLRTGCDHCSGMSTACRCRYSTWKRASRSIVTRSGTSWFGEPIRPLASVWPVLTPNWWFRPSGRSSNRTSPWLRRMAADKFVASGGAVVVGPFDIAIGRCAVVEDAWAIGWWCWITAKVVCSPRERAESVLVLTTDF